MSEKPISLIDDETSSQIAFNADTIINNHEQNRAFFEHAKNGNLYSPTPPEFEQWKLEDEAPNPDPAVWTQPDTGYVEAPEFAQPPKTYEDELKETIAQLTPLQCVQAMGAISVQTVSMRLHS